MLIMKNRNFLFLTLGKFISLLGTSFQDFALSLYVLKITGSSTKFASVLAISIIPQLILGPISGVFADWCDRKKMVIICDILSFLTVLCGCASFLYKNSLSMGDIYIIVTVLSIISVVFSSASSTIIPSIVKKEDLTSANSINSFVQSISSILGPVLSGTILGFFGIFPVLIINAASFFISAAFEFLLNFKSKVDKVEDFSIKKFETDFMKGLRFILKNRVITVIIVSAVIINFAINPIFNIGWIYVLKKVLLVTDAKLGLAESIMSAAMIPGSVLAPFVLKNKDIKKYVPMFLLYISFLVLIFSVFITPDVINLFGKSIIFILLIVTISLIIMLVVFTNVMLSTFAQKVVPNDMLGRVNSVMQALCMGAIPFGQMIFGLIFDNMKSYIGFLIGFAIMFFASIYCIINFKRDYALNSIDIIDK